MRLLPRVVAPSLLALWITHAPLHPLDGLSAASASPPTLEMQAQLRKGFQAAQAGLFGSAELQLTASIAQWEQTRQPADELAALYKTRGIVRLERGQPERALSDFSRALQLSPSADAAEVQRTYQLRARAHQLLGNVREQADDLSDAIRRLDALDAIEATNPYLYAERAAARMRLQEWDGAAEDALQAEAEFGVIGDKIRKLLASADAALALYGAGDVAAAVEKMKFVFKSKGIPASNNPDDIGLLQALARKDAELHLAYAAELYSTGAGASVAEEQWTSGCIRLEAYVQDAVARRGEELALRAAEAKADETGQAVRLRASSVSDPFGTLTPNTDFNAALNGLDPKSPYVTQRPQQGFFWYKTSEGEVERRDRGVALAEVDESLSCRQFRSADWLRANRPEWATSLVNKVVSYSSDVPQKPIVMPRSDRSESADRLRRQLGIPTEPFFTPLNKEGLPLKNTE
ncbi:hypothetical protein AB1Y20_020009 [Prymnesium parvum]|uniref:Tetratricopeptide repeat protein n=1 Tax=Prymnesium parvum TaxID=97485 RepID=A0AB34JSH7_PRYPA